MRLTTPQKSTLIQYRQDLLLTALIVLVLVGLSELVSTAVSQVSGSGEVVSISALAIVFGVMFRNCVSNSASLETGAGKLGTTLLQAGIVMQGIRLSISDTLSTGASSLPYVLIAVAVGLIAGTIVTHLLQLPSTLGALLTVGTTICGNSAIAALGPTIQAKAEHVAYAVATITLFGLIATFGYPYLLQALPADATTVGQFLGTSVHDTSQVVASSLIYDQTFAEDGESASEVAIVTKLVRNLFMLPLIPIYAYWFRTKGEQASRSTWRTAVPWFLLGFILMAGFRSVGDQTLDSGGDAWFVAGADLWKRTIDLITDVSIYVLAGALAALGLTTSFTRLKVLGFRPIVAELGIVLVVASSVVAALIIIS